MRETLWLDARNSSWVTKHISMRLTLIISQDLCSKSRHRPLYSQFLELTTSGDLKPSRPGRYQLKLVLLLILGYTEMLISALSRSQTLMSFLTIKRNSKQRCCRKKLKEFTQETMASHGIIITSALLIRPLNIGLILRPTSKV